MDTESIKKRIDIIESLRRELKTLSEMLNDLLENDSNFAKAEEDKIKVREEAKTVKNKIMERSDVKRTLNDISEKRAEIKEAQETLSLELIEYYRQNSVLTIEDGQGRVREMKISVRLSNPK